ncbi:outer membrane protein [Devosia sp.]|uniref:outer membrane protein n=1 Tax=Devosia sp. TaxID=1871048 RepID=UPI003BADB63B
MTRFTISLLAGVAVLGFASTTFAADLIVDAPAEAPAMAAASGNWDGAYIGAFAGYGWGTLTDEDGYWGTDGQEYAANGWQAGLTAGANFTVSEAIVAGIAADIAWADIGGDDEGGDFTYNTNWTGSLRARLGFDGGAFLPYVTGGLAFANNTLNDSGNYEDTQTHIGWTAGVGVEFAVADNVSLDLQYRYSDYGSKTYSLDGDYDFSLTSHAVTAGINFKF